MDKKLIDNVVLITGAGRGWGRGIARVFAREGASVIVTSRTRTELDITVSEIVESGGKVTSYVADIQNDSDMATLFSEIEKTYGKLDVLVNNAAILPRKHYEDFSRKEADQVLGTNLRGPILCCKLAIPLMKKDGGSIINVSSAAGIRCLEFESVYSASKHGLEGFSKSLSIELKPLNIAVNTVSPGGANLSTHLKPTSMTEEMYQQLSDDQKKNYGDPTLYSDALIFLGMQRGNGITGQRIICYDLSERIRRDGWDLQQSDFVWNSDNKGWQ